MEEKGPNSTLMMVGSIIDIITAFYDNWIFKLIILLLSDAYSSPHTLQCRKLCLLVARSQPLNGTSAALTGA